jgi:hypothetical protein
VPTHLPICRLLFLGLFEIEFLSGSSKTTCDLFYKKSTQKVLQNNQQETHCQLLLDLFLARFGGFVRGGVSKSPLKNGQNDKKKSKGKPTGK